MIYNEIASWIIGGLVTLGAILQGIDATFNLIKRWKSWRETITAKDKAEKRSPKLSFRLTQRILILIPWYLLVASEVGPLYTYFSSFIDATTMMFAMISYLLTLLFFPVWFDSSQGKPSKKYLHIAVYFVCLELVLANLVYFGAIKVQGQFPRGYIALLHVIGFSGFRYAMLFYVGTELRLWFNSLPKR